VGQRWRTTTGLLALVAAMSLAGVACSKDGTAKADAAASTTTTEATTTTTSTTVPPAPILAPLTGAAGADPALLSRPALAVKIDNSPPAMPQFGINRTDVTIEIQVEGISRLMAVFHSQDAARVGPTRSARFSDPDLLALFVKPLFGWSGANERVTRTVLETPWVKNVHWNAQPKLYQRTKEKRAPHNLITSTAPLFALADPGQAVPTPIFDYLAPGQTNAAAVLMPGFTGSVGTTNSQWVWDPTANRWVRWQYGKAHSTDDGQAWADNVVVLQTQYTRGPTAVTIGSGQAWVATGGTIVQGTWTRADRTLRYTLTDATGQPMRLAPGRTWVELPEGIPIPMAADTASGLLAGAR